MRTKALILAAAFSAVGITSSTAQVYSQNAVGYYTLNLRLGFNLVANQFINGDNSISTVFPVVPDGSEALTWNSAPAASGGQQFNSPILFVSALGGWIQFDQDGNPVPATAVVSPGGGVFLNVPEATTITLVGEVPETDNGTFPAVTVPAAFGLISQGTPQSLAVNSAGDALPANDGDNILFWNPDANPQAYRDPLLYIGALGGWLQFDTEGNPVPVNPTPAVGEAFFYNNGGSEISWTRTFNVD